MNKRVLSGIIIALLLTAGCADPLAEMPLPTPMPAPSTAPSPVLTPQTPSSPTQSPPAAPLPSPPEGKLIILSEELRSLEREIDVLVDNGSPIGPDHYEELESVLKTLEGTIANEDRERLERKLNILRGLSPQTEAGTDQNANVQKDKPAAVPPKDYAPAKPDPEFDYYTWTLPAGASTLRLSLPADISRGLTMYGLS